MQKSILIFFLSLSLLTLRSLSTGFSELPDKAFLSYSHSYNVTKYLVETYGQEKMTSLLLSLRYVPALVPIGGQASPVPQSTPTAIPPSSFDGQPTETSAPTGPPVALTLILLVMCCALLVLVGVVVLGFVVRNQNSKREESE